MPINASIQLFFAAKKYLPFLSPETPEGPFCDPLSNKLSSPASSPAAVVVLLLYLPVLVPVPGFPPSPAAAAAAAAEVSSGRVTVDKDEMEWPVGLAEMLSLAQTGIYSGRRVFPRVVRYPYLLPPHTLQNNEFNIQTKRQGPKLARTYHTHNACGLTANPTKPGLFVVCCPDTPLPALPGFVCLKIRYIPVSPCTRRGTTLSTVQTRAIRTIVCCEQNSSPRPRRPSRKATPMLPRWNVMYMRMPTPPPPVCHREI